MDEETEDEVQHIILFNTINWIWLCAGTNGGPRESDTYKAFTSIAFAFKWGEIGHKQGTSEKFFQIRSRYEGNKWGEMFGYLRHIWKHWGSPQTRQLETSWTLSGSPDPKIGKKRRKGRGREGFTLFLLFLGRNPGRKNCWGSKMN